ncbi:MAG TPA: hypothetical protein VHT97_05155 [Acidimicrobiales bacterium]|nr:hypothetical protein [Acidimicrobiales bacterium]
MMAVGVSPAWANVTAVTGSTYGYRAYNISLFGGSQSDTGPTPSATLASNASNSPQSGSATSGLVAYGPAVLFTSDGISVDSTGTTGAGGYVFTEASVDNINKSTTQPSLTGSEILTADNIYSECLATSATPSGSTSISGGSLQTDSGLDLNGDGDYTDAGEHAPVSVTLPSSPTANTTYYGHIHLSSTATDNWKLVFNEQSTVSGTLTVNAVHEYFGVTSSGNDPNSVLHGDLVIGRAVCGLTF